MIGTILRSLAVLLLTFGFSGMAGAFHDGGVAQCDGCHSIHQYPDNPLGSDNNPGAISNTSLLKGSDASSTCLNCHSAADGKGLHIKSADGSGNSQGGDFYWMTKDYTVAALGGAVLFSKDDHGHNVIARDFGMMPDTNPNNVTAPGGNYPNINLGCDSCHDPHGQVAGGTSEGATPISGSGSYGFPWPTDGSMLGSYRLLGDVGYVAPGGLTFTEKAPIARATNPANQTYGAIVDYGSGMTEFCQQCHDQDIGDAHRHPVGKNERLTIDVQNNYNRYVASGDFNGIQATAFDALVPFERGVTDRMTIDTALSSDPVNGVDSNSNIMCLTCHRAHASAHANAGRWDFEVERLLASNALLSPEVDKTTAKIYYKSGSNGMTDNDIAGEYGEHQRSLCNKCHVQD